MSKIVCPDCGSDNVMTERRLDGYHICRKCCFYWRNEEAPKPTLFDRITTSPEVLAEKLVYVTYHELPFDRYVETWHSTLSTLEFKTKSEAIAATVDKLKEVCDE